MPPMEDNSNLSPRRVSTLKSSQIVVLGSAGVGKSSLVKRFLDGFFPGNYSPTVEDSYQYFVQLPDGVYHSIEILDTAGLHQFPAMKKLRIEAGEAFVIVYAIDNLQSYRYAVQLIQEVLDIKLDNDSFTMILVGNKLDFEDQRQVATAEAEHLAQSHGCSLLETSAKFDTNVYQMFTGVLAKVVGLEEKLQQQQQQQLRRRSSSIKLIKKLSKGLFRRNSDLGNNNGSNSKVGCVIS